MTDLPEPADRDRIEAAAVIGDPVGLTFADYDNLREAIAVALAARRRQGATA